MGDAKIHHDTFLGQEVDVDFIFYNTATIIDMLQTAGFRIIDVLERQPYPGVEYPSTRAYVWIEKSSNNY